MTLTLIRRPLLGTSYLPSPASIPNLAAWYDAGQIGALPYVFDSFTRANSASSLGSADTGQAWTAGAGTWGISGNQGYTVTDADQDYAYLDAGVGDGVLTATITSIFSGGNRRSPALMFRGLGSTTFLFCYVDGGGNLALFRRIGAGFNSIATAAHGINSGDPVTFAVTMDGPNITIALNGVVKISTVLTGGNETTFASTNTFAGMTFVKTGSPAGNPRFDNFTVTSLGRVVTVSGNEITDVSRATNTAGDGLSNDDSYGIWEATTNLVTNGGMETNTTGWGDYNGSASRTRVTSEAKFGTASLEVITTATNQGAQASSIAVTAATVYTLSFWVKATSGKQIIFQWNDFNVAVYLATHATATYTGTGAWERVSVSATTNAATTQVTIYAIAQSAQTFYIDGVQFEQKPIATPYVHTDGGTATRVAARVQAPQTLVTAAAGWIAMRVKLPYNHLDTTTGLQPILFRWQEDGNNMIRIMWVASSARLFFDHIQAGVVSNPFASPTWTRDASMTIVYQWSASAIKYSINGAAFTSTAVAAAPTLPTAILDIGSAAATQHMDGRAKWVAFGKGTLSDANATTINGYGDTVPLFDALPGSCTGVWGADGLTIDEIPSEADPIAIWPDLSGNGRHAYQTTLTKQPLYKAAIQGGRPVMRFDGVDDFLQAVAVNVAQPDTIFLVAKSNNAGVVNYFDGNSGSRQLLRPSGLVFAFNASYTATFTATAWNVFDIQFNAALTTIRVNNGAAQAGTTGAGGLAPLGIGAQYTGVSEWFSGDIAELIIYSRALSDSERVRVARYLGRKYNLVVA